MMNGTDLNVQSSLDKPRRLNDDRGATTVQVNPTRTYKFQITVKTVKPKIKRQISQVKNINGVKSQTLESSECKTINTPYRAKPEAAYG